VVPLPVTSQAKPTRGEKLWGLGFQRVDPYARLALLNNSKLRIEVTEEVVDFSYWGCVFVAQSRFTIHLGLMRQSSWTNPA